MLRFFVSSYLRLLERRLKESSAAGSYYESSAETPYDYLVVFVNKSWLPLKLASIIYRLIYLFIYL